MDKLKINIPPGFEKEKLYVLDIITEFSGLEFESEITDSDDYRIIFPDGKYISIQDYYFFRLTDENNYIDNKNIPVEIKHLNNEYCVNLPVIYGKGEIIENENGISLGIDIFGSIFFMLSRWEEAAVKDKDGHGRFPGEKSLAVRKGFIRRPVVDEYIGLLKKLITKLDPSISFKQHEPKIYITCDVDSFEKFLPGKTLKMFAGHALKRLDPVLFISDLIRYGAKLFGARDPYDQFERIFRISEKFDTKPVFFILAAPEGPYNDGWFARLTKDPAVFRELASRGAEIGLHYGYFSLLNENNIRGEKYELEKKYGTAIQKGRAHFLQFDVRSSYSILERSGIKEDYTLGYSKYAGFRCGTGRAFRPWDFNNRKPYDIVEKPLIVMDTTLYGHKRMKRMKIKNEFEYFTELSRKYKTDITILIHNSSPSSVFNAIEEVNNNFEGK
ncbi:MAG: hypothetical protein JXN63_01715 [Candidatus Delongbacteria bacterium]|nr:hypothetical protein [Candidatus Delongbacteria bacterium]